MDKFSLKINGTSFWKLPEGQIVNEEGPQLIKEGEILLNGKSVSKGFKQYKDWKESLPKQTDVTEVCIDDVKCSSSAVLSSIVDDISQCIDPHEKAGLKSFEIKGYRNLINFELWPLRQLVPKCSNLLSIKMSYLGFSTAHNKTLMMSFCAEACLAS